MIYKEQEIGKPTREQIEECYKKQGFRWNIEDAITYWEKRDWNAHSLNFALQRFSNQIYAYIKRYNLRAKRLRIPKIKKSDSMIRELGRILADAQVGEKALEVPKIKRNSKTSKKPKPKWIPYEDQLKDSRWYAFRKKVLAVRGHKCERCGSAENLQIHHPKYVKGCLAWEYSCKEVIVVCRDCHKKIHGIAEDFVHWQYK